MFRAKSRPIRSKNVSASVMMRHLDRDFQVLQPPQGVEQVGDLLLHVRRLVDDQGQADRDVVDRARAADVRPRVRGDACS